MTRRNIKEMQFYSNSKFGGIQLKAKKRRQRLIWRRSTRIWRRRWMQCTYHENVMISLVIWCVSSLVDSWTRITRVGERKMSRGYDWLGSADANVGGWIGAWNCLISTHQLPEVTVYFLSCLWRRKNWRSSTKRKMKRSSDGPTKNKNQNWSPRSSLNLPTSALCKILQN